MGGLIALVVSGIESFTTGCGLWVWGVDGRGVDGRGDVGFCDNCFTSLFFGRTKEQAQMILGFCFNMGADALLVRDHIHAEILVVEGD